MVRRPQYRCACACASLISIYGAQSATMRTCLENFDVCALHERKEAKVKTHHDMSYGDRQ